MIIIASVHEQMRTWYSTNLANNAEARGIVLFLCDEINDPSLNCGQQLVFGR